MAGEGKRFVKGIFKDTAHIDQPEGSWRYARNIIMTDKAGSISNEGGNTPMVKLLVPNPFIYGGPNENLENYLCLGVIPFDNDRMIFFLRDRRPDTTTFIQRSEIGLFDPSRDTGFKYTTEEPASVRGVPLLAYTELFIYSGVCKLLIENLDKSVSKLNVGDIAPTYTLGLLLA